MGIHYGYDCLEVVCFLSGVLVVSCFSGVSFAFRVPATNCRLASSSLHTLHAVPGCAAHCRASFIILCTILCLDIVYRPVPGGSWYCNQRLNGNIHLTSWLIDSHTVRCIRNLTVRLVFKLIFLYALEIGPRRSEETPSFTDSRSYPRE